MAPTPESVFALLADRPGACWLDGGDGDGWSILVWDPAEVVTDSAEWPAVGRGLTGRHAADGPAPFSGGCLGYLGYGAGYRVAPVPAQRPTPEPEVWLGRYEGGLCHRNTDRSWHIGGTEAFRRQAEALLDAAQPLDEPEPARRPPRTFTTPRPLFEQHIQRILAWIRDGDCYQVNLTRPVLAADVGDPWPAYRRLRAASGAGYGAYLTLAEDLTVLSNSPELFVEVRGNRVASVPVKGTRPRHEVELTDAALADALRRSPKDRAELTMIVDLVRNDLGRVARTGSVVTGPRRITAHANVHHASQRIEATLLPEHDVWSALEATFPPGSVTGAPKIRACQRIAELETSPRGVYCGAIGYVADGGDATWSVAIRSAVWHGTQVRYHVGGGVVAASTPEAEWLETVDKGTALARAFFGTGDPV